jgi:phenylacetate-CoA ligase
MINKFKSQIYRLYGRLIKKSKVEEAENAIIEFEALDASAKEKVRTERLLAILKRAYLEVPYYRELFDKNNLKFTDADSLNDFEKIPILTKKLIKDNFEKIKNIHINETRWIKNQTTGSTGSPLIFIDDQEYFDIKLALGKYQARMNRKTLHDTTIKLWGFYYDIDGSTHRTRRRIGNWLRNQVNLNSRNMTNEQMAHFVRVIKSKKSVFIDAYVQSAYELAKYIIKNGIVINNVSAINTTANTLFDFMREEIEKAFNCYVYNRYGTREASVIAFERTHNEGLQVSTSQYIVEVLNEKGQLCNPGEEGDVVITNFSNFAFPFIRYYIGDRAIVKLLEKTPVKSCVSFEKISGRVSDMFVRKDGSLLDFQYFVHLVGQTFNSGWIEKMQVVQLGYHQIQINIVKADKSYEPEKEIPLIRRDIQKEMGEDCQVDFNFLDQIETSQSGKFQYVRSLINKKEISLNSL